MHTKCANKLRRIWKHIQAQLFTISSAVFSYSLCWCFPFIFPFVFGFRLYLFSSVDGNDVETLWVLVLALVYVRFCHFVLFLVSASLVAALRLLQFRFIWPVLMGEILAADWIVETRKNHIVFVRIETRKRHDMKQVMKKNKTKKKEIIIIVLEFYNRNAEFVFFCAGRLVCSVVPFLMFGARCATEAHATTCQFSVWSKLLVLLVLSVCVVCCFFSLALHSFVRFPLFRFRSGHKWHFMFISPAAIKNTPFNCENASRWCIREWNSFFSFFVIYSVGKKPLYFSICLFACSQCQTIWQKMGWKTNSYRFVFELNDCFKLLMFLFAK